MKQELTFTTKDGVKLKTIPEPVSGRCDGCYLCKVANCTALLGSDLRGCKYDCHIWVIDGVEPYEPTPVLTKLTNLLKWVTGI